MEKYWLYINLVPFLSTLVAIQLDLDQLKRDGQNEIKNKNESKTKELFTNRHHFYEGWGTTK